MKKEAPEQTTVSGQKPLSVILDEIEERANMATPGPWEPMEIRGLDNSLGVDSVSEGFVCEVNRVRHRYKENAAFIASARTDVPVLVKALRRAVEAIQIVGDNETVMVRSDICARIELEQIAAILNQK